MKNDTEHVYLYHRKDMDKNLNIGIDIDGVIVDLVSAMLPILSESCGYGVTHADITEYDIGKALKIEGQMAYIWKAVYNDAFLINAPAIKGALDGLNRISNHAIILITGRPQKTQIATEQWLGKNFIKYDRLIFSQQGKHIYHDDIDMFIEDQYEEACNMVAAGIPTILFNQPWNQRLVDSSNIKRVRDWEEITEYIQLFGNNE
ncbi:MAG: hypothetical protein KAV87_29145 [Desulfobacteraceae bacterium]|nr:hypothetical protein [Desulfobacteraceae bacterium]